MASIFSQIIAGELPGRFVHTDDLAVAFLTIAPVQPGHTLVVPRQEIDSWLDVPPDLWTHLQGVARTVGAAVQQAFQPERVGLVVAGIEVPHCHIHLIPFDRLDQLDFGKADPEPDPADLDDAAERIRAALG